MTANRPLRAWLGDDLARVLFIVTHWHGKTFTGSTFHIAPTTGSGPRRGELAS